MNLETRNFVTSLLNKYNSYQNVVDIESNLTDNTSVLGSINGNIIEIEDKDITLILLELCEALNVFDEVLTMPVDTDPKLLAELKSYMEEFRLKGDLKVYCGLQLAQGINNVD